jgi:magnesium transporter
VWRAGKPVDVELDLAAISDYLAEDDTLVWADVYDPDHTRWRRWPRSWD